MHNTMERPTRARGKRPPETARTAAEFFSGIGLVRLALERVGWRVVFANDLDPDKQEIYRHNFGDAHLTPDDVRNLSPSDVPACSLFTASFPCNDLSIAGAMQGLNGKESSAFWGFMHLVNALGTRKPPLILLENVVGFLMSHGGKDFESAMLALNEAGYAVDAFILNALHFVPQSRARLFVVAKKMEVPRRLPDVEATELRPEALALFMNAHPNIRWDIRKLPKPPKRKLTLKEIVEDLSDDDEQWWNAERAEYFMKQLSPRHLVDAKLMMGGRSYTYGTAFRRVRKGRSMAELRTDNVAGCLRTPRGGSGRQILFKAGRGKYRVRLLTPRECARLQGVPESFKIEVSPNKALFGFGDAVCVPAVEWIAKHYLNPVADELIPEPSLFEGAA